MKLIKLNRKYHGFPRWAYALEFSKRDTLANHRNHVPYLKAFTEIYGKDQWYDPSPAVPWYDSIKRNENWRYDMKRRRIYFKDPSVMSFVELKLA